ncbi:MAG TPA: glycosyltransferase [Jatrophihabitans sp.]|nr:glycosyltransferase [Jatrophihabitans sp.]
MPGETARTDEWPVLAPPAPDGLAAGQPPAFSVVVAAFQAAGTIATALDSALAQTYPATEIVVCDDGSTDGTWEILQGYGTRIRAVRQANGGEGAAKNAAVRLARGEYVVVLDADDVFLPRRLEALAWLAACRPDLDVLTTDAIVEADGAPVRRAYHAGWPFPVDDQRSAILERNFVFGLAAVRRDRWLAVGGFDERLSRTADWEFWQRLILSGSRVGLVDEPLARYRLTGGTLSSDRRALIAARLAVLRRAAERADLTPHERAVVAAATRRQRCELTVREAEALLERGGGPARAAYARVLAGRGFALRTRLGAALAVAAPGVAARRHRRRTHGTVEIGSGLRVPSDQ